LEKCPHEEAEKIADLAKISYDDLQAADLEFRIIERIFYQKLQNLQKLVMKISKPLCKIADLAKMNIV